MTSTLIRTSIVAISLAAGTAFPAIAQPQPDRSVQAGHGRHEHHFLKSSAIIGQDVANRNGEIVGNISDLIFDRGTGRIEHALVRSGAILGIGGKTIAVPYSSLGYDAANTRFLLDMTPEQIERASSFVPEDWAELSHRTWLQGIEDWWTRHEDRAAERTDPVAESLRGVSPIRVRGTIGSVDREIVGGVEQVCVEVLSSDGQHQNVALGPTWYVMGQDTAPMRGDTIEAQAVAVPRDEHARLVALNAAFNGKTVNYRDNERRGRWSAPTADGSADAGVRTPRLMLVSDLVGAPASCRDDSDGEIQNVVIERRSGTIAILGFDPNDNILGLADTIVGLPYQAVHVAADRTVHIDANKDTLLACRPLADDVSGLSQALELAPYYVAFDYPVPEFTPRRPGSIGQGAADAAWGPEGRYVVAFRDGRGETVSGRVKSVQNVTLHEGDQPAMVVVITTNQGERSVVIAPAWYSQRQDLGIDAGDQITVRGRTARIDGVDYTCANSVSVDGRSVELWRDGRPIWNAS